MTWRSKSIDVYVYNAIEALVYVDNAKNAIRLMIDVTNLANRAYMHKLVYEEGMFTKPLIKNWLGFLDLLIPKEEVLYPSTGSTFVPLAPPNRILPIFQGVSGFLFLLNIL